MKKFVWLFALVLCLIYSACGVNGDSSASNDTDLQIITREGHPTYYGSVEESHAVWGDVKKGKIIFGDSYDTYTDQVILSMEAYRDSDLIRDIYINFENFEMPAELTVEEVLPIIATYMPYDIMEEYYQYSRSEKIVSDDHNDGKEDYYVITYSLTEEAKDKYYTKEEEHPYSGSMDVIIKAGSSGIVQEVFIQFGTPRWMSSLKMNGCHIEEWNCDLLSYKPENKEA